MAVVSQLTGELLPVGGVRFAAVEAGVRYANRVDLVLFELAPGSRVAAVFTRNAFCAAPVQIARGHLQQAAPRYLLINTGNANAGTGARGLDDARACCEAVAAQASELAGEQVDARAVLPFSTGVIGESLPVPRIVAGLPKAFAALGTEDWLRAARGIMTTDTRPKAISRQVTLESGRQVTISGVAKGAGMIKPNMATMLAFVFTDAEIEDALLAQLLREQVNNSFNRITVDGDTSTNDSCVLVATGAAGAVIQPPSGNGEGHGQGAENADYRAFVATLREVFAGLAMELIRDAEGATKFVTVDVINGASSQECLAAAYAIAESPLVKTALFASDPNWGRILAAVGRAGVEGLIIDDITIDLGETRLVEQGGRAAGYTEQQGQAEMNKQDITITVDLARGLCRERVWTADLSEEYVRINADYRS